MAIADRVVRRAARAGAIALLAASLMLGAGPAGAIESGPGSPPDRQHGQGERTSAGPEVRRVTLLTGDRVDLFSADGRKAAIRPAPGRTGMKFITQRIDDHLYVVPADALPLVRSGRLDRRLFDVLGLVRAGYDDARTTSLPLLVRYASPGTRKAPALRAEGVTTKRRVPSIAGASVRVAKDHAAEAWPRLRRAEGVERYWLNGKRRVLLSESVPQIGAPKAWDAGFDGEGVTVAVIDTGVDAEHPDLTGKVKASKDFTGEGPDDGFGHGTHVASIVAGTGAASDGKYTGVAPKAELVSAKVCDSGGWCTDEAILGGMEWAAVTQKAKIANLSLGGTDTPEIDPLEEAVDQLTEQTGTLFVIAAGNEGSGAGTIGSPGSAEAALTVGAVDKSDAMADFSSRGPTVGDAAIKPDVTAPGVDIAAGRAQDTEMGPPVEDFPDSYIVASGTSMATPHVAGAAAILAQKHPDWKSADLKGALMASAAPQGKASVFDQGAGRIDVEAALGQTVVSDPGSISFGRQLWPHDDDEPVTEQLTYRNLGSEDVELELAATMTGPDGEPAPEGTVKLGATTVTVPAGGSASVDVTVATDHDGADGAYSGRVVASTGDLTVTTPIAVEKEIESYDVTIEHVDADGKPTNEYGGFLFSLNRPFGTDVLSDEPTVTLRLPKGDYLYVDDIVRVAGEAVDIHRTVWPTLSVDKDQTLRVDARKTRPFEVTVPEKTARTALVDIGVERVAHLAEGDTSVDLAILSETLEGISMASVGKNAPKADLLSRVNTQWGELGESGNFLDSPYVLFLSWFERGRVPNGFTKDVKRSDLAKVRSEHGVQATKRLGSTAVFGAESSGSGGWTTYWDHHLPTTFTQYHTTKDVIWSKEVAEYEVDDEGWPDDQQVLSGPSRRYRPGKTYRERWNVGVFGPAFPESPWPWAGRAGDALSIGLPLWSDGAGNAGLSRVDEASTRLFRGEEKIAESEHDGSFEGPVEVPAGPATYRLETSATRSTVADYSTRLTARWTFRSAHAGSEEKPAPLPLWAARFRPRLDDRTLNHEGPIHLVPVDFQAQQGAKVGQLTKVSVEVSADDGKTWTEGTLLPTGIGTYALLVQVPQGTDDVSLRAAATDNLGNTVEQTLIRAYGLAP